MMSISRSAEPITCLRSGEDQLRLLRLVERLARLVGDHLRTRPLELQLARRQLLGQLRVARTASMYSTASGDDSTAANFAFIAATSSGRAAGTIAAAG